MPHFLGIFSIVLLEYCYLPKVKVVHKGCDGEQVLLFYGNNKSHAPSLPHFP